MDEDGKKAADGADEYDLLSSLHQKMDLVKQESMGCNMSNYSGEKAQTDGNSYEKIQKDQLAAHPKEGYQWKKNMLKKLPAKVFQIVH